MLAAGARRIAYKSRDLMSVRKRLLYKLGSGSAGCAKNEDSHDSTPLKPAANHAIVAAATGLGIASPMN